MGTPLGDDHEVTRHRAVWVRRIAACGFGLVLAGTAVLTAMRLAGIDTVTPLPQLVVFFPYAPLPAALALAGTLALRLRWPSAVAGGLLAVQVLLLVPRFVPDSDSVALVPVAQGRLRVLTANLLSDGADASTVIALVRRNVPDLLAIQELTPRTAELLDRGGLAETMPYRVWRPEPGVTGMALYSRLPLREQGQLTEPTTFVQPWATIEVAGQTVRVLAVHTYPPLPGRVDAWLGDLSVLRRAAAAEEGPQILLGDFNATLDHASFRELLAVTGLVDVHDALGLGIVRTWPARGTAVPLVPMDVPLVHIDHVLISRQIKAIAAHEEIIPGSDHRAVVADLVVLGPPR